MPILRELIRRLRGLFKPRIRIVRVVCRHRFVRCVYPVHGEPRVECVECNHSYKMGK